MKPIFVITFGILNVAISTTQAQHCAPIVESYLNQIDIERNDAGISIKLGYTKTGGRTLSAYQAYLIAFSNEEFPKVAKLSPKQILEKNLATVIETKLIKRNESGTYTCKFEIETEPFVAKLLKKQLLSKDRIEDIGGWKSFDTQVRLALFIPYLEDKEFATLDGLPEDRHECTYGDEVALLFETLPQQLTVHFGIAQATRLKPGRHYIQLNGRRPASNSNRYSSQNNDSTKQ